MPQHSTVSFGRELRYAAYKDIPVSYLLCKEDAVIPEKVQKDQIGLIEKENSKKVDITSIKTGHGPSASAPQQLID